MTIDIATIKTAAAGRWLEIIPALCPIDAGVLDGAHHPCPRCLGVDRFRAFGDFKQTGGMMCGQCFVEKNGDGLAAVQWLNGESFPQAINRIAKFLGLANAARAGGNGELDIVADVARLKRIPLEAFKAFGAHQAQRGKLTVCRLPMYNEKGEHCSDFDLATLDDKWLKGMAVKGKPTGLFLREGKLPEPGDTVHLVEGVKDAAALASTGRATVGLSTKEIAVKFARLFRGCDCIVIPDRDTDGEAGAKKTAARLAGVAASVKIATLPTELLDSGGDGIREILAKRNGAELLAGAIDDAVEFDPTTKAIIPAMITDPEGRTVIANGKRFVVLHGKNVRFCFPWKAWLIWDGRRWKVDDDGAAQRLAKSVSDFIWHEARNSGSDVALKFASESAKARSVSAMLNLAASDVPVSPDAMDSDSWLLNCQNGTIDRRTAAASARRPADADLSDVVQS